jgi:hypothetical protein
MKHNFHVCSAAVKKSRVGRRCTIHSLATVAGKWLTGARHRGVGFKEQMTEAAEECVSTDNDYSDVE